MDTFNYGEGRAQRAVSHSLVFQWEPLSRCTRHPQPWLHRLLPVSESDPLDFTWWNQAVSAPFRVWSIPPEHSVREAQPGCVCARLLSLLRLNQAPCVSKSLGSLDTWAAPTPGYSEFWLNRVSSDSPRPAFSALGTDPRWDRWVMRRSGLWSGNTISCGAGSAEQARRAPEPRRDVHHVCLRCGGQEERFHIC